MSYSVNRKTDIQRAILDALNESPEVFRKLEEIPERVAETVVVLMPEDTGEAKQSIEIKARKTAIKRLSTRRVKLGQVYSDDDPAKINTLEFGRSEEDDSGATPEFAVFRRAAALWHAKDE